MASKRNAACAALAALAFALPASATLLYSTNFASPTFTTGALAGQGGWGVYTGSGSAKVQNTVTDGGEPAVDIDGAGAYYLYGPITPTGVIATSADLDFASSSPASMVFGAISSVSPLTLGNFADDLAAGVSLAPPSIVALPKGNPDSLESISAGTWYNVTMKLDYVTQTYDIAVDGTLLASNIPFCGYSLDSATCTGARSSQFEGIAVIASGLKSGANYFGDVSIAEAPEPATWTMMFAGRALTGLALRRRRPLAA